MKTIIRFSSLLLLLGLLSTACERDDSTPPTTRSPSAKAARSPCGFDALPARYDVETGQVTKHTFKFYLCEEVPKRETWSWYDLDLTRDMVKTIPEYAIDDLRLTTTSRTFESTVNAVLFRFAANAIVLQHYQESQFVNPTSFTLTANLVLSPEQQQTLGLRSNTVLAGLYPVIYNPVTNTYNAVLFIR
jgi:hypothetical protein